jgi:Domain of unknown function (DUF4214)
VAAKKNNKNMARLRFHLLLLCILSSHALAACAAVPTQFIAKMYTEVLGRAPDPQGWSSAVGYFQGGGCDRPHLTNWGSAVFSSAEFSGTQYDPAALTLILYRSILNREPDTAGYRSWLMALEDGRALQSIVSAFFESREFAELVPYICNGGSYSFGTLGTGLAIEIPTSQIGGWDHLTEAQLQSLLDSAAPGATVYLQQESVVYLNQPLDIPTGVTLATYGLPGPQRHAVMARLIRASAFAGPMVRINTDNNPNPSGSLKRVWVDGQRAAASRFVSTAIDIEIYGGVEATVDGNFVSNSLGWSTIHSYGSLDGRVCLSNTITGNVITAYASVHANQQWTDGLSLGCENSFVAGNQIVDPTDVGIVVFNAYPATQQSIVTENTVVSAGNSAFGALAFDPLQNRSAGAPSFGGAEISNNTLWSGPNTHFIIGLAVGSRPWFRSGEVGRGATAIGNTTAGVRTLFGAGIVVSGMESATVQENVFTGAPIPASWTGCATGNVLASVSAGLASGSIQPYRDVMVSGCMSDYSAVEALPIGADTSSGSRELGQARPKTGDIP